METAGQLSSRPLACVWLFQNGKMVIREATPSDAPSMARIHVDTWRSTYRGIIQDEILAGLSYVSRQEMWHDALTTHRGQNFTYIVENEAGEVVGFVVAGRAREAMADYEGEIYAIYLNQEYQGRGWGKQLFLRAVERLVSEGMNSMMLWVLADNPTRGFYEALGGREIGQKNIEIGSQRLVEVAYGWHQLNAVNKIGQAN